MQEARVGWTTFPSFDLGCSDGLQTLEHMVHWCQTLSLSCIGGAENGPNGLVPEREVNFIFQKRFHTFRDL